jgi:hypothetical protein
MTNEPKQTLTDLNDFITPSQACIKPVEQTNKPEVKERDAGAAAVSSSHFRVVFLIC